MSRHSRLRHNCPKQMWTLAHHQQYATSTTYFPRCYSYYGKDIFFPTKVLPFLSSTKINGVGSIEEIEQKLSQTESKLSDVKTVSLSIHGTKCQQGSTCVNVLTFCSTMVCFCFNPIMRMSSYRNKFYPKYIFNQYDELIGLINKFEHVETLIINFQDNFLNRQKMEALDEALYRKRFKRVVLRNMTYFMDLEGMKDSFPLLRNKSETDFKFIWEQFVLLSNNQTNKADKADKAESTNYSAVNFRHETQ